jgi:hypothetical protein
LLLLTVLIIAIKEGWNARGLALICGLLYLFRLEFIGIGAIVLVTVLSDGKRATRKDRVQFIGLYLLLLTRASKPPKAAGCDPRSVLKV